MGESILCMGRALVAWLLIGQSLGWAAPAARAQGHDPVIEARVLQLTRSLRCLVCQNQSIAESDADLAVDLKTQVYEKIAQGLSDEQVMDFMVQRYGDFVLYRPPVKSTTLLLWFGPFLLLAAAVVLLVVKLKGQGVQGGDEDRMEESP